VQRSRIPTARAVRNFLPDKQGLQWKMSIQLDILATGDPVPGRGPFRFGPCGGAVFGPCVSLVETPRGGPNVR